MEHGRPDTEEDRWRNNDLAWKNLHGYHTDTGCPCWDRTPNICIPKHSGYGYNLNFWCVLCCFLCQNIDKPPRGYKPTDSTHTTKHTDHHDHNNNHHAPNATVIPVEQ